MIEKFLLTSKMKIAAMVASLEASNFKVVLLVFKTVVQVMFKLF